MNPKYVNLIKKMEVIRDDPMWADHAEISKFFLDDVIIAMGGLITELEQAKRNYELCAADRDNLSSELERQRQRNRTLFNRNMRDT